MSGWDDLVTTALLGTERRALPDSLPAAVSRLVAVRASAGPSLLDAAAGYVSYLSAGACPAACPVPEPAPRQVVDLAPEPAQVLLRRLLDAGDAALVDEWLGECAERGRGVRAGLWTVLADAAVASTGPDPALVRAALGQRGLAFLRLNPAWRPVLRPSRTEAVATRKPTGPAWSDGSTRTALGAVRVTRSLGRRRVAVGAPGPDLRRAVADADLDAWHRHTGLLPGELLDLLRSSSAEHLAILTAGLAEAAVRQHHQAWATALVRAGHVTPPLVAVVPPAEHDALARSWIGGGHDPAQVARWLALLPGPWSDPVTDAALRSLVAGQVEARAARRLGTVLAHRAPLSAHEQVQRLAGECSRRLGSPPAALAEAARVLALRAEIRDAFSAIPPTEETP